MTRTATPKRALNGPRNHKVAKTTPERRPRRPCQQCKYCPPRRQLSVRPEQELKRRNRRAGNPTGERAVAKTNKLAHNPPA